MPTANPTKSIESPHCPTLHLHEGSQNFIDVCEAKSDTVPHPLDLSKCDKFTEVYRICIP